NPGPPSVSAVRRAAPRCGPGAVTPFRVRQVPWLLLTQPLLRLRSATAHLVAAASRQQRSRLPALGPPKMILATSFPRTSPPAPFLTIRPFERGALHLSSYSRDRGGW